MAKNAINADTSTVILLRCATVSYQGDGYGDDSLVACSASEARNVNADEKQKLLDFSAGRLGSTQYLVVEPLTAELISDLVSKALVNAEANRIATEKRRVAEQKRRDAQELKRKQKRLEKLKALEAVFKS